MHKKYAKDGLEIITVSGEDPKDKGTPAERKKIVARLNELKATWRHVELDSPPDEWQKKLRVNGVPCIYVFNRNNQFVKKQPVLDAKTDEELESVDYDVINKTVSNLFKKK